MMTTRVAAELKRETDAQVELEKGQLGAFSVSIDDRKVIDTNRLWYPTPSKVAKKIKTLLAE